MIVDAFAGVGGNTIQFAARPHTHVRLGYARTPSRLVLSVYSRTFLPRVRLSHRASWDFAGLRTPLITIVPREHCAVRTIGLSSRCAHTSGGDALPCCAALQRGATRCNGATWCDLAGR